MGFGSWLVVGWWLVGWWLVGVGWLVGWLVVGWWLVLGGLVVGCLLVGRVGERRADTAPKQKTPHVNVGNNMLVSV